LALGESNTKETPLPLMARIEADFENSATTRVNTGENGFNKTKPMHQNFTVGIRPKTASIENHRLL